jgi:hypothetical protein
MGGSIPNYGHQFQVNLMDEVAKFEHGKDYYLEINHFEDLVTPYYNQQLTVHNTIQYGQVSLFPHLVKKASATTGTHSDLYWKFDYTPAPPANDQFVHIVIADSAQ